MAPSQLVGSRAQVWHGTALKTAYGKKGLKKKDLMKNKAGKIVSIKAARAAKRKGTLKKWMKSEGLEVLPGQFGLQKVKKPSPKVKKPSPKKSTRKRTKGKGTRRKRRKHKKGHKCRHKSGRKKGKYRSCYAYNH